MFGFGFGKGKTVLRSTAKKASHERETPIGQNCAASESSLSPKEIPEDLPVESPEEQKLREEEFPHLLAQERSFLRLETERIRKLLSFSLVGNIVLVLLLGIAGYMAFFSRNIVYFAATQDLRILKLEPLSRPYISEAGLMNWAANVVTETFSLDFNNYRNSLARVRVNYSTSAFKELENALNSTLQTIVAQRLIMYAVCDQTPRLLTHGILDGRYSWRIEVPLTVSLQGASKMETYRWKVEIVVSRTNVAEKTQGIEVIQVIAIMEPR